MYNSQGGFTHSELYSMPVYLRRFYTIELQNVKEAENKAYEKVQKSTKSRIHRPGISR